MRFASTRRMAVAFLAAVIVAAAVAGCGNDPYAPLVPTPATKTDTFSGSFAQSGSVIHSFPVSSYGPITITMNSVGPLATMGLGVALGYWDGANCSAGIISNVNGKAGAEVLSGAVYAGNYCIRVYDSGNVPADWTVTYTISVLHP